MDMWLLVGLGNPGPTYASHRHNAGFMIADELAARLRVSFSRPRGMRAEVAEGRLGPLGPDAIRICLVKPQTFMNDSGSAVAKVLRYYKVSADHLIVMHDELDLDFGRLRLKFGGGDNGHNGLRSLRRSLSTGDFYRVRFGVGRPPGRQDPAAFVLSGFSGAERKELALEVARAGDAVEALVVDGLAVAQNQFNS